MQDLKDFHLGLANHEVRLLPHDPLWAQAFTQVQTQLARAMNPTPQFHHIGSTAIPGISAKPVLDILGVTVSLEALEADKPTLEKLGFRWREEYGLSGRRYLTYSDADQIETFVHLHFYASGHPAIAHHILFRDYLRRTPTAAREYDELKQRLTRQFRDDRERYVAGKAELIAQILQRAQADTPPI